MRANAAKFILIMLLFALPAFAQDRPAPNNCLPANSQYIVNPLITIIAKLKEVPTSSPQIEYFADVLKKCEENVGYVTFTSGEGKVHKRNLKYVAQLKDLLIRKHGIIAERLNFIDRGKSGLEAVNFYSLRKNEEIPKQ
jgi:hypothetical protein